MEKEINTKRRIVYEALRLFSESGYDGVSMRQIAAAVGVKGASLYNHFDGKEDIFKAIFGEMTELYENFALQMNLPSDDMADTASMLHGIREKQLLNMADRLFTFFTENEFVSRFRRLLVSEQFRSDIAAEFYRNYYLDAPVNFQSAVFMKLQEKGDFTGYDPHQIALHFYSPILYMLSKSDLGYPSENCKTELRNHVLNFCKLYKQENQK